MVLVNQSVTTLTMLFPVKADFFGVLKFAVKNRFTCCCYSVKESFTVTQ